MGVYGIGFWLPTIVKSSGFTSDTVVGFVTAIPYLAATIFMVIMGRSADATGKRRLHVGLPILLGVIGLVGSAVFASHVYIAVTCLAFATMGCLTALALFWSLPPSSAGSLQPVELP